MGFMHHFEFAFVVVAPTLAFAATIPRSSELPPFASFISTHGRSYTVGTLEYEQRRKIYEDRIKKVQEHNAKPKRLWSAVVNHLSDYTDAELADLRGLRMMSLGKTKGATSQHSRGKHFLHQVKSTALPEAKSWAHLKSLERDTNQRACGSCWAVATATVLSANSEINGYNSSFFSAQELVSCTPNPHHCGGTGGCAGATVELAMNWVMDKGLVSDHVLPYQEGDGTCKKSDSTALLSSLGSGDLAHMIRVGFHTANSAGVKLGLTGWERLPENEYEPLLAAVALRGPVAISVGANEWNSYGQGIFDSCGRDAVINHAVTLIGYGKDKARDDTPYWIIKNSWGLSWGENGNIRVLRKGDDKYCGTDYQPEVGTGCDGGPSSVPVCGMCGMLYDSVVPYFAPTK